MFGSIRGRPQPFQAEPNTGKNVLQESFSPRVFSPRGERNSSKKIFENRQCLPNLQNRFPCARHPHYCSSALKSLRRLFPLHMPWAHSHCPLLLHVPSLVNLLHQLPCAEVARRLLPGTAASTTCWVFEE